MKWWGCLLGLALLAGPARAQDDLTPDQVSAYVALVKADQARERGARAEALQGYRDAQARYTAIARKDPRWHPELVQYRLSYCRAEIAALERGEEEAPPPPPPAPDPVAPPSPEPAAEPPPPAEDAVREEQQRRIAALEQEQRDAEQARAARKEENEGLRKAQRDAAAALKRVQDELARERAAREEIAQAHERTQASHERLAEEGRTSEKLIRDLREQVEGLLADARKDGGLLRKADSAREALVAQCAALSNQLAAAVLAQRESATALQAAEAKREELEGKLRQTRAEARAEKKANEEAERLRIDVQNLQTMADTCSRQLAAAAEEKQALQARITELVQAAGTIESSSDACEETRLALERAREELQALRAAGPAAPAETVEPVEARALPPEPPTTGAVLETLAEQVAQLTRELDVTQKRLAESEKEARDLLKEVTFLKRRY